MSDSTQEVTGDGSPESGAQYDRPKSRLPRLPQPSTPKPPENEGTDFNTAMKTVSKAMTTENKINTHALSVRQYLENAVVPILMKGLLSVVRERPEDPIEYLASYLIKNNPTKQQGDDAEN